MSQNSLALDTLLNNIETGVWITNSSGDILYTNHAYRQIRQLPKEWFDSHNAFQDHSDGITSISPTRVVCETKQEIHLVQHVTGTEGGVSISLFISCRPIFDATGNVEYVVGSVIPIEQLNRMYLESLLTDHQYYSTAPQFKMEPDIVAEGPEMKRVLQLADQVADIKPTILISGESGVGKNVLAGYAVPGRTSHGRDQLRRPAGEPAGAGVPAGQKHLQSGGAAPDQPVPGRPTEAPV